METLKVVQDAYASFQRGDIAAILASCSEDVQWFVPGDSTIMPVAGLRRGLSGVADFFSTLAETQAPEQFEPREFIAQGDTVVSLGEYRWRVRNTSKVWSSRFAHVFTVQGGKVVAFREFYDTAIARDSYTE